MLKGVSDKGRGRKEYFEEKKAYEELLRRKKREEGERLVEKIMKDKTGKKFWEDINRERKKTEGIDKSIGDKSKYL